MICIQLPVCHTAMFKACLCEKFPQREWADSKWEVRLPPWVENGFQVTAPELMGKNTYHKQRKQHLWLTYNPYPGLKQRHDSSIWSLLFTRRGSLQHWAAKANGSRATVAAADWANTGPTVLSTCVTNGNKPMSILPIIQWSTNTGMGTPEGLLRALEWMRYFKLKQEA